MKKLILFTFLMAFSLSIFSQEKKPVAVDDTVYVSMGEIVTFNPLLNDYDPEGVKLKLQDFTPPSNDLTILSTTDSTITFKMPDYFIGNENDFNIPYILEYETFNPDGWGEIRIFPKFDIDTLYTNDIKATIFPQNLQFWDAYTGSQEKGYFFPADAKTTTLFNYGLWIGGMNENEELHFAGERYKQNGSDFWSGPLSDDGLATTDSLNSGNWFRSWKVDRSEINNHIANYQNPNYNTPEAIANWPAHGDAERNQAEFLAPFIDVDGDLEYHPEKGDYPFIKGDQAIFFIYNDQLEHTESGALSLGVEIHCMAWAIDHGKDVSAYNSTMFFSYKFFNRSNVTYNNTYLGAYADLDIGNPSDDYLGCHVENGNFYGYNGDGDDETSSWDNDTTWGYGLNIPTQSMCILGGPFMDNDNIDNPLGECNESINGAGFSDGIIDNERYGMNRFVYFNNSNAQYMTDPQDGPEYYDMMKGIWKDGTPLLYGGNGHASTGGESPTRFMFPGESDACNWGTGGIAADPWTEETANNNPGDRRGVATMGPFTFEAGSVHYLDIAMVTAPGDAGKNSKDLVQDYIAQIKQDYLVDPNNFGSQYVGLKEEINTQEELVVYPNPVHGSMINFEVNNPENIEYFIYNSAGQIIENGQLPAQKQQRINIEHIQSGWYILEVKSGNKILRSKLVL